MSRLEDTTATEFPAPPATDDVIAIGDSLYMPLPAYVIVDQGWERPFEAQKAIDEANSDILLGNVRSFETVEDLIADLHT